MIGSIKSVLERPLVLWGLFLSFAGLTIGFALWIPHLGGEILDAYTEAGARRVMDQMTEAQRISHGWMTLLLDMAYPLVYGLLSVGLAYKAFGTKGTLLAMPGWVVMPLDLSENIIEILALWDVVDLLALKNYITPMKNVIFVVAMIIALVAAIVIAVRKVRNSNAG